MASPFERALEFVLKEEGGFVDDPDDAGGATNFGITQKVYDRYRKKQTLPLEAVRLISGIVVKNIYYQDYWKEGKCDDLPPRIGMIHFDGYVNIAGANKVLQRALSAVRAIPITIDGKIGPETMHAVGAALAFEGSIRKLTDELLWQRVIYYRKRVDQRPVNIKFLRNWLVRLEHLRKFINE